VWTRINAHERHRRWIVVALVALLVAAVVGATLWVTVS
jgi:hypothetical protein